MFPWPEYTFKVGLGPEKGLNPRFFKFYLNTLLGYKIEHLKTNIGFVFLKIIKLNFWIKS